MSEKIICSICGARIAEGEYNYFDGQILCDDCWNSTQRSATVVPTEYGTTTRRATSLLRFAIVATKITTQPVRTAGV